MLGYLNKSCVYFKVELIVRALGMVWCRAKKWPAEKMAGKKMAGKKMAGKKTDRARA